MNESIEKSIDEFMIISNHANILLGVKIFISVDSNNIVVIKFNDKVERFKVKHGKIENFLKLRAEKIQSYIDFDMFKISYDELQVISNRVFQETCILCEDIGEL